MAAVEKPNPIGSNLNRQQAEAIFAQGKEAVVFTLLELTKRLAEAEGKYNPSVTTSTPSAMVPVYHKPPVKTRGKKTPGTKPGHPGSGRKTPIRIDHQADHRCSECPELLQNTEVLRFF